MEPAAILSVLCRIALQRKRYEDAERFGLATYATLERIYGPEHSQTRAVAAVIHQLYDRWDKPDEAGKRRRRSGS